MSKKQVTYSLLLATVLALGVAALVHWRQAPPALAEQSQDTLVRTPTVSPEDSSNGTTRLGRTLDGDAGLQDEDLMDPPAAASSGRALSESEARRINQAVTEQDAFPHDVVMDEYKTELWADIQANPPPLRPLNDPEVDADMAYRLYMYYGNCSVMPRTQTQIDSRLDRLAQRAESADARYLERIERSADRMIDSYEFCSAIPADVDPRLEAIHWMARAVQLGHEIAQVQYYEKVAGFLLRSDRQNDTPPLVMVHSGILAEYKANARMALNMAMQNGHPEAYLAMSEAMLDGVIFQRDPVMALAYLRAAQTRASQNQMILRGLERQQYRVTQHLTAEQIAQAEKLAMDLELGIGG